MSAQYWYNLMGMPEVFRSGALKPIFTLQSWWMNYTTNYWRELLHRLFTGRTGWGKEIPLKWRLGAGRHVLTSIIFIEAFKRAFGLDYKQVALLGVLPSYLSPPGQIVAGLFKYVTADTDYQKTQALNQMKWSWKAFVPGSKATQEFLDAWNGEISIKELFFYVEKGDKDEKKKSSGINIPI